MSIQRILLAAAAVSFALPIIAEDADAAWRWRRRSTSTITSSTKSATNKGIFSTSSSNSNFKYSSGISRGEYDRHRRLDTWYNEAYNGFRPSDFR